MLRCFFCGEGLTCVLLPCFPGNVRHTLGRLARPVVLFSSASCLSLIFGHKDGRGRFGSTSRSQRGWLALLVVLLVTQGSPAYEARSCLALAAKHLADRNVLSLVNGVPEDETEVGSKKGTLLYSWCLHEDLLQATPALSRVTTITPREREKERRRGRANLGSWASPSACAIGPPLMHTCSIHGAPRRSELTRL